MPAVIKDPQVTYDVGAVQSAQALVAYREKKLDQGHALEKGLKFDSGK